MPACIQELHAKGLAYPVLIGGAAINRAFGYRALYPGGKESEEIYEPGVFYCKDAFEGLAVMDQLIDADARDALDEKLRAGARAFREKGEEPEEELELRRRLGALGRAHRRAGPDAAVLGRARDPRRPRRGLPPPRHARPVQAPLGRARRQRRGVAEAAARGLPPAPGADVARAGPTCTRARCSASSPATRSATRSSCSTPRTARRELTRFVCPRQPKGDAHLPRRLLPPRRRRRSRRRSST